MTDQLVRYTVDDGIATITFDSPHNRNALSSQLLTELDEHLTTAEAADDVRAAVIAAAGPVFCAGADLKERADPAAPSAPNVMARLLTTDLPLIARVQGPVRAGGTGIVAGCDIAVAHSSVDFAIPEVQLGLVPAIISVPLARVLDRRSMQRYFLTGEPIDADEAARIGLITLVADDLDGTIDGLTRQLRDGHPAALRRTKRLMREAGTGSVTDEFAAAADLSAEWFATDDAQEGIRARLEKRPPAWR